MEKTNKKEERTEDEICLSAALLILKSGDNTRKMLREKLTKKGFSAKAIDTAIEKVNDAGLINEERLFLRYAEYLANNKYYGPLRVRQELARRFDREVVDMLLSRTLSEIDFSSVALMAADKQKNKDIDFTVRRLKRLGFYTEHIRYAVKMMRKQITEEI